MVRVKSTLPIRNNNVDHTYYLPIIRKPRSKRQPLPKFNCLTHVKDENKQYYTGKILLGSTNNLLPETWTKCKSNFHTNDSEDILQLDFDTSVVVIKIINDSNFLKDIFTFKVFQLDFEDIGGQIYVLLYFSELPFTKFNKRIGNMIKTLFSVLFEIPFENIDLKQQQIATENVSNIENLTLFKEINKERQNEVIPEIPIIVSRLKPILRNYQKKAVEWMIFRERINENNTALDICHPLYEEIIIPSEMKIYYNKYTGYIEINKPVVETLQTGGILADEMGLGKSVELLACILTNKKPIDESQATTSKQEECDLSESPEIIKQPKKPKMHKNSTSNTNTKTENESKKLKVQPDWVKGSSKKSPNKIALEKWYENKLKEVTTKKVVKEESVFCVCGNNSKRNIVECTDCLKQQHGPCVGYKKMYGSKYRCPQCWCQQELLDYGTTLIVCPLALKSQWSAEICKHVRGGLKVLIYEGANETPLYPTKIKEFDVVLTTYNVLQSEFRLLGSEQRSFRGRQPKYAVPGSPLTRIKWWRLCLDEAQTVDVPGKIVSEMAKKLTAVHRWAITGTPISRDIRDLYGLIDYLDLKPYSEYETWEYKLYMPYAMGNMEPMVKFMTKILWRSAKADVIDQISIPQQTIKEHWIDFSPVEKYFYGREHEMCSADIVYSLQNHDLNVPLNLVNKNLLKKVLTHLLALRQLCTFPNVADGRYLTTRKHVNSMKDLLEALITKNTNECEEHLRIIISSLNGLAGINLLLQKPDNAIEFYRRVLELDTRFNKDDSKVKLTIDKLQLIHTMYNLCEVLMLYPSSEHTLRDSTLKEEYLELEKQYIEKSIIETHVVAQEAAALSAKINKHQDEFILNPGQWYIDLFNWVMEYDMMDDYYNRLSVLKQQTDDINPDIYRSNVKYQIASWDEAVSSLRIRLLDIIDSMYENLEEDNSKISIPEKLVQNAMDCHLPPQKKRKNTKCEVCIANDILKDYESKIFSTEVRADTEETSVSNKGSWKSSVQEFMIKALVTIGQSKNANEDVVKDGKLHLKIIDLLKKEFKAVRKLWTFLDQHICKMSEINICKVRLTLKTQQPESQRTSRINNILKQLAYVQENKLQAIHMLEQHELSYQKAILTSEEKENMTKLERNLGCCNYLKTLWQQQYDGKTPDPCPICKTALSDNWSVLPCGHSYCIECFQCLTDQGLSARFLVCSICRQRYPVKDVTFIRSSDTTTNNPENGEIEGNLPSKVQAIVKLLLTLKNNDKDVKVLVFSTWVKILSALKDAFEKNSITCEIVLPYSLDKSITNFKCYAKKITALLLPVHVGSKGLNLIEATHVILVEPLLNPGDELQAIGRVHRIGQTKPTFVHKFFAKDTIEESIHHATSSNTENWAKNKVTLLQLKSLFTDETQNE